MRSITEYSIGADPIEIDLGLTGLAVVTSSVPFAAGAGRYAAAYGHRMTPAEHGARAGRFLTLRAIGPHPDGLLKVGHIQRGCGTGQGPRSEPSQCA